MEFKSIQELKKQVEENENVATVQMRQLRDAYGADRLGWKVCQRISNALAAEGLAHFPHLPENQYEFVRVYRQGSRVADLITAVREPKEETDQRLREYVSNHQAEVLEKVRELVCE